MLSNLTVGENLIQIHSNSRQSCGSGIFIPDPDPVFSSRISDPKITFFSENLKNRTAFYFWKNLRRLSRSESIIYIKSWIFQKYGLGIRDLGPGFRNRKETGFGIGDTIRFRNTEYDWIWSARVYTNSHCILSIFMHICTHLTCMYRIHWGYSFFAIK
jgi:hypothetical protein